MPSNAVDVVKSKTDPKCQTTVCRDGRCSLSLNDAPQPYVLVSLEHQASPVQQGEPRCDYLFVAVDDNDGVDWIMPIELTAGAARVSKFLPQLRAGASIADKLIPSRAAVRFRPTAVYGGELRRIERVNFLKPANQVQFRNHKEVIRLVRCGSPLTKALKQ